MRCAHFFMRDMTDFVDTPHGDADSVSRARFSCAIRTAFALRKIVPKVQVHHLNEGAMKREGTAIGRAELPQQGRTVHGPQTRGTLRHSRSGFRTTPSRRNGAHKGRERCQGEHAAPACRALWSCCRLRFAETFCPIGPRIGIRASPPLPFYPAVPRVGIGD